MSTEDSARITDLFIYPVKSCRGIRVDSAELWETGLFLDRFWMVVDERNRFVTQRNLPRLALIETQLRFEMLRLRAPGMLGLDLSVQGFDYENAVRTEVQVWNDRVAAFEESELASTWVSKFIGRPLKLVRIDPDARRLVDARWAGPQPVITQFADGFPLLVITRASFDDFNARLRSEGHPEIPIERFRPSVVIDGVDAWSEDHVLRLTHADYSLRLVKPCTRCRVINVDPATGEMDAHVLDSLASFRMRTDPVEGIVFGMNAIVERGQDESALKIGDALSVELDFA